MSELERRFEVIKHLYKLIMQKLISQNEIKCMEDVTECGGIIVFKTIYTWLVLEDIHIK